MNNDTVISHKITGFYNAYDFLIQGQNSLDPEKTLSRQKQLYSERKRDPDFLRNYVYSLSNADELDYQIVKEYLQTPTSGQLSKPHNIKFIYKYSVYQFSNYLQLSSEAYQYMVKNASSFEKYFPKDQVKTRVLWVAYSQAFDAANSQDKNLFDSSIVILSKYADGSKFLYKELDGRTTGALPTKYIVSKLKMYYYENSDDQILYLQTESEFIELIWEDGEALNSFAFDYQKKFSDQEKLEKAKLWIERSVELNRHYKNLDTYMSILYKLDYNSEAITIGKEAIQLAVRDSLDYGTTQISLDSFQSLLNK